MRSSNSFASLSKTLVPAFAAVVLVACGGAVAPEPTGSRAQKLDSEDPPALPSASLAVPAGNSLAFLYDAAGVQIYDCASTGWVFRAPDANLYEDDEVVATHYAGPTWQANDDESTVVGKVVAAFTPDPSSIPWLLLRAVSHAGDPEGTMANVTFIQRLSTVGGKAPASGCDATTIGTSARVDYTATYYFYTAQDTDDQGSCNAGN